MKFQETDEGGKANDIRLEYEEREITQDKISGNRRRWEAAQRKSAGN